MLHWSLYAGVVHPCTLFHKQIHRPCPHRPRPRCTCAAGDDGLQLAEKPVLKRPVPKPKPSPVAVPNARERAHGRDGELYGRNGSGRSRDGRGPPPQRQARERPLQNGVAAGEQAAREHRKEGTGSEEPVAGIPSGGSTPELRGPPPQRSQPPRNLAPQQAQDMRRERGRGAAPLFRQGRDSNRDMDQPGFRAASSEAPDADLEQPEIGDVEALKEPESAVQPSANMPMLQAKPTLRRRPVAPSTPPAEQLTRGPSPRDNGRPARTSSQPSQRSDSELPSRAPAGRGRGGGEAVEGARKRDNKREKMDVEARKTARSERRQKRSEEVASRALVQEEIFEVGEEGMSVGELATRLAINEGEVIKTLFMRGLMVQVNQVLDKDTVKMVAEAFEVEVLDKEAAGVNSMARKTVDYLEEEDRETLRPRPPVVTVMGHVDHGKTSLLDFIRKTKVAAGEAGGITQAIGAYTSEVATADDDHPVRQVTFLDTPGHEAFSAMRARGTRVTDVAIIVVAADDGVRPQTVEAISHAKAAKVPIIVAINKIDKEGANLERVKTELSEAGLVTEEWGGDTPMVPISAKKGDGIDELLETVLLVAELEQLQANPDRSARGTVIEAHLDRRTGPVATLLVASGTLRNGDVIHAGSAHGKVRSLTDDRARPTEAAGPSFAVQMVGLNRVPAAGDEFTACASEQEARKIAEAIEESIRLDRLNQQAGSSMVTGTTFATMDEEHQALQHVNIILKADASGTCEAVKAAVASLPQDRVSLRFLLAAAAEMTTSDVQLAAASEGRIIGFNVDPSEAVQAAAKQSGVSVQTYRVIYELVDELRALMEGRLDSVEMRAPLGKAEVKAVFGAGRRRVAGCLVTEGKVRIGSLIEVKRGRRVVAEGRVASLRRVKDKVEEVGQGVECGLGLDDFMDWREGDALEAYEVTAKRKTLEEASKDAQALIAASATGSYSDDDYAD